MNLRNSEDDNKFRLEENGGGEKGGREEAEVGKEKEQEEAQESREISANRPFPSPGSTSGGHCPSRWPSTFVSHIKPH